MIEETGRETIRTSMLIWKEKDEENKLWEMITS